MDGCLIPSSLCKKDFTKCWWSLSPPEKLLFLSLPEILNPLFKDVVTFPCWLTQYVLANNGFPEQKGGATSGMAAPSRWAASHSNKRGFSTGTFGRAEPCHADSWFHYQFNHTKQSPRRTTSIVGPKQTQPPSKWAVVMPCWSQPFFPWNKPVLQESVLYSIQPMDSCLCRGPGWKMFFSVCSALTAFVL